MEKENKDQYIELKPLLRQELNDPSLDMSAQGSQAQSKQNQQSRQKVRLSQAISSNIFLVFISLACIFAGGYFVGRNHEVSLLMTDVQNTQIKNHDAGDRVNFSLFWDAWDLLGKNYVDADNLEPQELVYGAIRGMLAASGDQYTTFFDPGTNKAFTDDMSGSFEGIGAEIGIRDNFLTVVSPLDDSPAKLAGLRAGDRIIEIDGEISSELSIEGAVKLIRGEKGTQVVLTIYRDGDSDTRDIAVTRDTIVIESVTVTQRDDGITSIRIAQFGNDTTAAFKDAIDRVRENDVKKIIIDLRNNPGGLLDGAVQMTGLLVPEKSTVVIEQLANGESEQVQTHFKPLLGDEIQYVVLINQGSASASEIMAGAMNDLIGDQVTLVGETSFGKGSVQQLIPMDDGTAAKITIAKWLTPSEREIDGVGIEPDVIVEITEEDFENERDPQLDAAVAILNGEDPGQYVKKTQQELAAFQEESVTESAASDADQDVKQDSEPDASRDASQDASQDANQGE